MKTYNIYTEGNYFIIKSEAGEFFYGHRKDVIVDKDNINLSNYRIFNVKDFSDKIIVKIPNILKQDNSPYTLLEWETFYKENTGNFNGGGSAPTSDPLKLDKGGYVGTAQTLADSKQDVLVSGVNIKTINGNTLLGSGDLTLSLDQNNKTSVIRIYNPIYDLSLLAPSSILASIQSLNLVIDEFTTPVFQFFNDSQAISNWVSNFGKGNTSAYTLSNISFLNSSKLDVLRITRAEAVFLQQNSSFIVGLNYVITDADVNLYKGTEITLLAITPDKLSLQGSGLFYTPKYDELVLGKNIWTTYMEGTLSNVIGVFQIGETITADNGALGIYLADGFINWIKGDFKDGGLIVGDNTSAKANTNGFTAPQYPAGSISHWGGKTWANQSGNVGAFVDDFTLDGEWLVIPYNNIDYNTSIDDIQYDFINDAIIYRKDRFNNEISLTFDSIVELLNSQGIDNPIKTFQWGAQKTVFDNVINNSSLESINCLGKIFNNTLESGSFFQNNIISSTSRIINSSLLNISDISDNTLSQSSIRDVVLTLGCQIQSNSLSFSQIQNTSLNLSSQISGNTSSSALIFENTLDSNSSILSNNLSNSQIQGNSLGNSQIQGNSLSNSQIQGNSLSNGGITANQCTSVSNTLKIVFNNLIFGNIFGNILNDTGLGNGIVIQSNVVTNGGSISENTLNDESEIVGNDVSVGGISQNTLNSSFIRFNTISTDNTQIQGNTLSGNSSINSNTLSNQSLMLSNTLSSSASISSNNLSNSQIQSNTLNQSIILLNTLSSGIRRIESNNLLNSVFRFSNNTNGVKSCQANSFGQSSSAISLAGATVIGNSDISKNLFRNQSGVNRLSYTNSSDALVVGNPSI